MSLHAIIQRRQRALFDAWVQNPLIVVHVEHPEKLGRLVYIHDLDDDGADPQPKPPGARDLHDAAIIQKSGNPDERASVWVRAKYRGYQGAYLRFIEQVYGVKATKKDLAGYNIDHLLNKKRSPDMTGYIRIEAVNGAVNQAWGSLFEHKSNASNPDFTANSERSRRTMSWAIAAKLMNQPPPRGPGDRDGIARLSRFFINNGLEGQDPMTGLTSMLENAYRFRR
ncbi:hypothetical protein E1180_05760 [Roseibium denhamense]|uniref:Uncharacterized protein n=1 Tax=Roseibium denhamense TaxID=76305 RepID=A0ABY1PGM5_9HYPH|nr:hypothetical protein [Roseibium denhamense]MTI05018.1 hypothetical protein [Roseibium denhamense]SMP33169.1 hypothetical protein SAMN06265374_3677 [Roseibium denhamense]